ncbi:MAG: vWA domain-containing protein [Chthoniobacterales bacterium]
MRFLFPWGLWFLLLLPVFVALYLLCRKPQKLSVSNLFLWETLLSGKSSAATRFFAPLQNWRSLLLLLLIFCSLVFGLANPGLPILNFDKDSAQTPLILAIDQRARMSPFAKDLREKARAIITALPKKTPLYLVVLKAKPEILLGKSFDRNLALQKIDGLTPSSDSGDTENLLEMLSDLAQENPQRIFLGRLAEKEKLPTDWQILPIGQKLENVAILAAGAEPHSRGSEEIRIAARVGNFTNSPFTGELHLSENDKLLAIHPLQIPAGQDAEAIFDIFLSRNDAHALDLQISHKAENLSPDQGQYQDDSASIQLPARPAKRILLIEADKKNLFLEKLLSVIPAIRVDKISVSDWRPEKSDNYDLSIFDRTLPQKTSQNIWQKNNFLFLDIHPALPQAKNISSIISEEISAHPLLQNVRLSDINLAQARDWTALLNNTDWPSETLARSPSAPLFVIGEFSQAPPTPPKRWAALGFDIAHSDLPLRRSFPLLIDHLISWLIPDPTASTTTSLDKSRESNLQISQPEPSPALSSFAAKEMDDPLAFFQPSRLGPPLVLLAFLLLLLEFWTYQRNLISK